MESTPDLNEAAGKVRSRRVLLAGAVGGLAAWLAAAAQRAMPAEAAAGDPVLAGRSNSAGGFSTELRANTTKPTLRAVQLGGGHAVRAEATSGRAVMAIAGAEGTGVWAYSPNHNGVFAISDNGYAVNAVAGPSGHALRAVGRVFFDQGPVTVLGQLLVPVGVTLQETSGSPPLSANQARLFARNNGVGKTQVCVEFSAGDIQVLATEA